MSGLSPLFITGTDTGSGKTLLTALLLKHLRDTGQNALAIKPICTGPRGDVRLLQSLQPGELSDDEMNPFWYNPPAAPIIAARNSAQKPTLAKLKNTIARIQKKTDQLLIEGAGGLMVPLAPNLTWEHFIQALQCPVLIAAENKLGAINHTLLTISRLQTLGLQKKIICLMNHRQTPEVTVNRAIISKICQKTPVFEIPFLGKKASKLDQIAAGQKKIKKTLVQILKIL